MKLNIQNQNKLKFSKNSGKIVLIILLILVSLSASGFLAYQIVNLKVDDQGMKDFKLKVKEIVNNPNIKKVKVKEELGKSEDANSKSALFIYNNDYSNVNPFKSLLRKQPKPKSKSQLKSKRKKSSKEKDKASKIEKPKIKFIGLLGNGLDRRAIIQLSDKESDTLIVKEGDKFDQLTVEEITATKLIIDKRGKVFVYKFGGEARKNGRQNV
ncbi:hypothetical protein [Selenihalanaerobacter shriftii]|uniref:Uncharacterized protein n=1 Tax=Selenihalanaerobacter shriftii TaxID=142842 RepID=A0A1T4P3T6_9FIRM|nr:hypothetical protein [Selenihalanaerobacter shriftii]SJZ86061.1 hypothetical protein SAMN02745118_02035 [Selenihalanaerobacter shriftii]